MIPKKIHYCWFGKNPKNKLIEKCILSWKKHLPDYEIIEWNEENFDINSNRYVKEAYEAKKWAFVSDYVRLWALKKYGGIYLDTDVEVFRDFEKFLKHGFFSGFENYLGTLSPITAVMGAERNHVFIAKLLDEYTNISFYLRDGNMDLTPNTKRITDSLISEYGIDPDRDVYQKSKNNLHIYPSTYFCNKSITSYSIHHFNGSWLAPKVRLKSHINKNEKIPLILKKIANKIL